MISSPVRIRRGFTLVEMAVAATLLGIVFAVLGRFLSRWDSARRSADDRAFALRTVESVIERAATAPVATIETMHLPEDAEVRLRAPQLKIVAASPDDAQLISVTASLSWQNAEGQRVTPVTLTSWRVASPQQGDAP